MSAPRLTPELAAKLRAECDRLPDVEHVRERVAEARAALTKLGPPSSPTPEHALYYPLLFLCEALGPVLRWLDDEPSSGPTAPGSAAREKVDYEKAWQMADIERLHLSEALRRLATLAGVPESVTSLNALTDRIAAALTRDAARPAGEDSR